ncbi:uncharacterized protein LOC124170420 [Ischnura elegans]|uniref:uncharacterized protein LOC124170420 n=1 Tax=Ischnura elegans TaxID=197161 RepID=UPI001ED87AD8|nr:uncharacterized protein LOC124170420 [Ischnura elegans]
MTSERISLSRMKWGSDTVMKFFRLYIKYPCLWDKNCADYRDRSLRLHALQDILVALNIDGLSIDLLKTKIHSLRSTYVNEITKVKNSKQWSSSAEDIYKPKMPWFKLADSFLRDIVWRDKNHARAVPQESVNETFPLEGYITEADDSSEPNPQVVANWSIKNEEFTNEPRQEVCEHTISPVESTSEIFPSAALENELDAFGKSVTAQMKNLPEEYAIELMAEIQTLLTKKRLKAIADKRASSSNPSMNYFLS